VTAGRSAAKYLWDAQRAAERIARFTAGRRFDDCLADDMLRAAVERQFEVIGEAFAGLRRADPALASSIPDLPRIVAFPASTASRSSSVHFGAISPNACRQLKSIRQLGPALC